MARTKDNTQFTDLALQGLEYVQGIDSVAQLDGNLLTDEEKTEAYRAIAELYFEERILRRERMKEYNERPQVKEQKLVYRAKRANDMKEAMRLLKLARAQRAKAEEIGNVTTVTKS